MKLLMHRDAWQELQDPKKVPAPVYVPLIWSNNRPVPEDYIVLCDTHMLERIEHLEAHLYEGVARSLHQPGPEIAVPHVSSEDVALAWWKGEHIKAMPDDTLQRERDHLIEAIYAIDTEKMRRAERVLAPEGEVSAADLRPKFDVPEKGKRRVAHEHIGGSG